MSPNRSLPSVLRRPLRVAAAAALALGLVAGAAAMPAGAAGAPGAMPMSGMPIVAGPRLDRMLERVGASAEQRQQIRAIADAARDDLAAQRDERRELARQMSQLFTQPTVDAAAAEALRQKMLAQHDKASQRMFQAMLDSSRVLTPEQRQKLVAAMQERRDDRRGGGRGPR